MGLPGGKEALGRTDPVLLQAWAKEAASIRKGNAAVLLQNESKA